VGRGIRSEVNADLLQKKKYLDSSVKNLKQYLRIPRSKSNNGSSVVEHFSKHAQRGPSTSKYKSNNDSKYHKKRCSPVLV
jgi:hypothetical protein